MLSQENQIVEKFLKFQCTLILKMVSWDLLLHTVTMEVIHLVQIILEHLRLILIKDGVKIIHQLIQLGLFMIRLDTCLVYMLVQIRTSVKLHVSDLYQVFGGCLMKVVMIMTITVRIVLKTRCVWNIWDNIIQTCILKITNMYLRTVLDLIIIHS